MTDSTFWKKISPAVDINGLAGEAEPKSARIKPATRAEVAAVHAELTEWLDGQPGELRQIGADILGHLAGLQNWLNNPVLKEWLIEDVSSLEVAALLSRRHR